MRDEVLDLLAGRIAKRLNATEIGRIGLDQVRIELVLANQLAEAVANLGAAVVPVSVCRLRRELFRLSARLRWFSKGPDFLDGTDTDAVRLAESTIDSSCLCHSHFGAVNKEGDIGRVGVTVTDEAFASSRLVNSGFESPSLCWRITKAGDGPNVNAGAKSATRQSDQACVSGVPPIVEVNQVASSNGEVVLSRYYAKSGEIFPR